MILSTALIAGLAASVASALPQNPTSTFVKRPHCGDTAPTSVPTGIPSGPEYVCAGNTADDRASWCDLSIDTDVYTTVPDTGVICEYWFNIAEGTVSPDGVPRFAQLVNGTFPGPPIICNWGDTVVVHVTNSLPNNGTTMHFHGVRQFHTNQNDGVPAITQCPTSPGNTYTYTWKADQYGHSWYHSHIELQTWMGVQGPILIHGPTTANFDVDQGFLYLNDWTHETPDALFPSVERTGAPTQDNGLINGLNVFGEDGASNQTGKRFETSVDVGTTNLFRVVNGAIDTLFKFSIDNHTLTVISNDWVPIEPYETDVLNVAIGQRYEVIINANQEAVASDFWIRAIPQTPCSANTQVDNIRGILHYGASSGTPTTTGFAFTDECVDEPYASLVPHVAKTVGAADGTDDEHVTIAKDPATEIFHWLLNNQTFFAQWDNATLLQISENIDTWTPEEHVIQLSENEWFYAVIETPMPVSHPIHLHGHDFFVLAQGEGAYNSSISLKLDNPPRRDVATLPAAGHLVIGFQADNPGAWLMHCHIGWHVSMGFALQFVEQFSNIEATLDTKVLKDTCDAWDAFVSKDKIVQEDSGV